MPPLFLPRPLRTQPIDPGYSFLIDHVWSNLADRLHDIKRSFETPAYFGPPIDAGALRALINAQKLACAPRPISFDPVQEILDFKGLETDCLLSVFALHRINDLARVLTQIRGGVKPGGLFLAAFPGGTTLQELRTALIQAELDLCGGARPRVHPTIGMPEMSALMQRARFDFPVVDHERIVVDYSSLTKLMHDLRGMHETNILAPRPRHFTRRALFARAEEIYRARFGSSNGALPATFDIIYVIGWAPAHPSSF